MINGARGQALKASFQLSTHETKIILEMHFFPGILVKASAFTEENLQ